MRWLRVLSVCLLLLPAAVPQDLSGTEDAAPIKAVWITRWGFKTAEDVQDLFQALKPLGVNLVFFQVRGAGDALYRSQYEPWSAVLSGTLGENPGWDPLATALEEGRRLGIEVHVWVNVFPAWKVTETGNLPPKTFPPHVMLMQPTWLAVDAAGDRMSLKKAEAKHNYAFLSPTHPGVQKHIRTVLEDLVTAYDVDGVHLDYVRFPDSTYSYDYRSRAGYIGAIEEEDISYAEWRRRNLTEFVGSLASCVREVRPEVQVSAAVWQKIESGKEYYLQDGIEWKRRGFVDFLVPMIYTTSAASFEERLKAYSDLVGPENVVAGMGPYLEAFNDSIFLAELAVVERYGARGISILNSDYALQYSPLIEAFSPKPAGSQRQ